MRKCRGEMEVDIVFWSACWRCVATNLCVDTDSVLNVYKPKVIGTVTKTYYNLDGILHIKHSAKLLS